MSLQLGPPWLVLVVSSEDGETVILRDNFTGAGFQRIQRARRREPGSYIAAMDKHNRFALNEDGSVFDPIAQTVGRYDGTLSTRGHNAYHLAKERFENMPRVPLGEKIKNSPSELKDGAFIAIGIILFITFTGIMVSLN